MALRTIVFDRDVQISELSAAVIEKSPRSESEKNQTDLYQM